MAKTLTSALLKSKKPVTKKVTFVLDPALAEEWREALEEREAAHSALKFNDNQDNQDRVEAAVSKVDELRPKVGDESVEFVFKAIGRKAYDDLVAEYQPSKDQQLKAKAANDSYIWNPDTFPPALVAASVVLPDDSDLTAEDIEAMWGADQNWNSGELGTLFLAAYEVNTRNSVEDLGKGLGTTDG